MRLHHNATMADIRKLWILSLLLTTLTSRIIHRYAHKLSLLRTNCMVSDNIDVLASTTTESQPDIAISAANADAKKRIYSPRADLNPTLKKKVYPRPQAVEERPPSSISTSPTTSSSYSSYISADFRKKDVALLLTQPKLLIRYKFPRQLSDFKKQLLTQQQEFKAQSDRFSSSSSSYVNFDSPKQQSDSRFDKVCVF